MSKMGQKFQRYIVHSSTPGSREWGKGDCSPFELPAVIVTATSSGASIEELNVNPSGVVEVKQMICYAMSSGG